MASVRVELGKAAQRQRPFSEYAGAPQHYVKPRDEPHWTALALVDIALAGAALVLAVALRTLPALEPFWQVFGFTDERAFMSWRQAYTALAVFQALALPLVFWAFREYWVDPEQSPVKVWLRAAAAVVGVQFAFISLLYVLKAVTMPHGVVVADLALLLALVPTWRAARNHTTRKRLARGEDLRNVLIVGADVGAQDTASEIARNVMHGRRVVGFLSDEATFTLSHVPEDVITRKDVWLPPAAAGTSNGNGHGHGAAGTAVVLTAAKAAPARSSLKLKSVVVENTRRQPRHLFAPVGTTEALDVTLAIDGLCVEEVFISAAVPMESMQTVVRACRERGVDVHIIPRHFPELGVAPTPWTLGQHTVMGLYTSPISRSAWAAKRALDIAGGLFGLTVFSPLILISCIAIKLENWRGPLFYHGTRVGLKGRHFKIIKLATMVPDADQRREELKKHNARAGPWFQIDSDKDPRITKVGHVLRKYTINELPQFWNVVRGDMSLVGPRPLATDEVSGFVDYDFRYYRSFDVKPGMTGLWQVYARKDPSFEKRIEMDFRYIDEWSVWLDIKLLLMTPLALFKSPGR